VELGLNIALTSQEPRVHILESNNYSGAFRSCSLSEPVTLGTTYNAPSGTRNDDTNDAKSLTINDDCGLTSFDNIFIDVIATNTNEDDQLTNSRRGSVNRLLMLSVFCLEFRRVIVEKSSIRTH
jgi:hypothetical protein